MVSASDSALSPQAPGNCLLRRLTTPLRLVGWSARVSHGQLKVVTL
ncbi:hypothetical protein [Streptomyces jumonjinensis]